MQKWARLISSLGLLTVCAWGATGCAAKAKPANAPAVADPDETPVPTVPPSAAATPLPEGTSGDAPKVVSTRPIPTGVKSKKGEAIGPIITYLGAARADGSPAQPESVDKQGVPTYLTRSGSGFILVIEAKPGTAGFEVGRRVYSYVPGNPNERADLEIISNRDLGNGSPAVCDRMKPSIGGIPAVKPTSFDFTQKISDAINDLSCRFETFNESEFSCTMTPNGDYKFVGTGTTEQYCLLVAKAYGFPEGITTLSVRVRDTNGNPGPVKLMRIRHENVPPAKPAK